MFEVNSLQAIGAIFSSVVGGGATVGILGFLFLKPKERLDSYPALLAQIDVSLIKPLKEEMHEVRIEVRTLRNKVMIYENYLMQTRKGEELVERTKKQFVT